jgi:hypothetical protein
VRCAQQPAVFLQISTFFVNKWLERKNNFHLAAAAGCVMLTLIFAGERTAAAAQCVSESMKIL